MINTQDELVRYTRIAAMAVIIMQFTSVINGYVHRRTVKSIISAESRHPKLFIYSEDWITPLPVWNFTNPIRWHLFLRRLILFNFRKMQTVKHVRKSQTERKASMIIILSIVSHLTSSHCSDANKIWIIAAEWLTHFSRSEKACEKNIDASMTHIAARIVEIQRVVDWKSNKVKSIVLLKFDVCAFAGRASVPSIYVSTPYGRCCCLLPLTETHPHKTIMSNASRQCL